MLKTVSRIVLLALVLSAGIALSTCFPARSAYVSLAVIEDCWENAARMGEAPAAMRPPVNVIRVPAVNIDGPQRLLGQYFWYPETGPDGLPAIKEQIVVYVLDSEPPELVKRVIVHEMLHAIWQRRITEPGFLMNNPDSEVFVCKHGGCHSDSDASGSPPASP